MSGDMSVSKVSFWNRFLNVAASGGRTGGAAACGRALEWGLDKPRIADGGPGDAQIPDVIPDALIDVIQTDILQTDVIQSDVLSDGSADVLQTDADTDVLVQEDAQIDAQLDGPVWLPQTYFDTDFTSGIISGTPPQLVLNAGSLSLAEDNNSWTHCYNGSGYPESVGWTEFAPASGWTAKNSSSGLLQLNTIDKNEPGYYRRSVPLSNSTGWIVEARTLLIDSQGEAGCQIQMQDDAHYIEFMIANTRIIENINNFSYAMDPRSSYFNYRILKNGSGFQILVNGTPRISGNAAVNPGSGYIIFHDPLAVYDGNAYWDYICYYTGGSQLPYVSSGIYTSIVVDLGASANNIGSGATLISASVKPANTDILFETRSGNINPPDVSWSNWISLGGGNVIQSPSARYLQIRSTLSTNNTQVSPRLDDYTVDYCTY